MVIIVFKVFTAIDKIGRGVQSLSNSQKAKQSNLLLPSCWNLLSFSFLQGLHPREEILKENHPCFPVGLGQALSRGESLGRDGPGPDTHLLESLQPRVGCIFPIHQLKETAF